jgi:hypothetical protein
MFFIFKWIPGSKSATEIKAVAESKGRGRRRVERNEPRPELISKKTDDGGKELRGNERKNKIK